MTSLSEIIDISPPVGEETAVWPGDVQFSRSVQCDIRQGSNIHLSSLTSTVHCGAHADAPLHYNKNGGSIDQVDLSHYLGPCQVLSVSPMSGSLIRSPDFAERVLPGMTRLLFKTNSQPHYDNFNTDFTAFDAEAIHWCGKQGIVLLGIDTASFDGFDSKDLPAHQLLFTYNIRNLECLQLGHVDDGVYELIALPLKLRGFDASPVRAILRRI